MIIFKDPLELAIWKATHMALRHVAMASKSGPDWLRYSLWAVPEQVTA